MTPGNLGLSSRVITRSVRWPLRLFCTPLDKNFTPKRPPQPGVRYDTAAILKIPKLAGFRRRNRVSSQGPL